MLAERVPGLLPDLDVHDALEVSAVHSLAGSNLANDGGLACDTNRVPHETPNSWQDPEAPWWAKLRRAARLIKEVNSCCEALNQPGAGWSLEREAEDNRAWRYHFRQPRPIPADLAAAVGDVVHNLRSAMDNAAQYLAARHVQEAHSRDLTEEEEALTEFPIRKDGQAFDAWLSVSRGKGTSKVHRHQLYGSQEVKAFAASSRSRSARKLAC
jgi:hypothetical protein